MFKKILLSLLLLINFNSVFADTTVSDTDYDDYYSIYTYYDSDGNSYYQDHDDNNIYDFSHNLIKELDYALNCNSYDNGIYYCDYDGDVVTMNPDDFSTTYYYSRTYGISYYDFDGTNFLYFYDGALYIKGNDDALYDFGSNKQVTLVADGTYVYMTYDGVFYKFDYEGNIILQITDDDVGTYMYSAIYYNGLIYFLNHGTYGILNLDFELLSKVDLDGYQKYEVLTQNPTNIQEFMWVVDAKEPLKIRVLNDDSIEPEVSSNITCSYDSILDDVGDYSWEDNTEVSSDNIGTIGTTSLKELDFYTENISSFDGFSGTGLLSNGDLTTLDGKALSDSYFYITSNTSFNTLDLFLDRDESYYSDLILEDGTLYSGVDLSKQLSFKSTKKIKILISSSALYVESINIGNYTCENDDGDIVSNPDELKNDGVVPNAPKSDNYLINSYLDGILDKIGIKPYIEFLISFFSPLPDEPNLKVNIPVPILKDGKWGIDIKEAELQVIEDKLNQSINFTKSEVGTNFIGIILTFLFILVRVGVFALFFYGFKFFYGFINYITSFVFPYSKDMKNNPSNIWAIAVVVVFWVAFFSIIAGIFKIISGTMPIFTHVLEYTNVIFSFLAINFGSYVILSNLSSLIFVSVASIVPLYIFMLLFEKYGKIN